MYKYIIYIIIFAMFGSVNLYSQSGVTLNTTPKNANGSFTLDVVCVHSLLPLDQTVILGDVFAGSTHEWVNQEDRPFIEFGLYGQAYDYGTGYNPVLNNPLQLEYKVWTSTTTLYDEDDDHNRVSIEIRWLKADANNSTENNIVYGTVYNEPDNWDQNDGTPFFEDNIVQLIPVSGEPCSSFALFKCEVLKITADSELAPGGYTFVQRLSTNIATDL